MTIMHRHKSYVEKGGVGEEGREERVVQLPHHIYLALSGRRSEISNASTAHIVWDDDSNSMLLIGSEETVDETASVLAQFVSGNRKLARTETDRLSDRQTTTAAEAKNLLLMSALPPELTISNRTTEPRNHAPASQGFSQFSGLPVYPLGQQISLRLTPPPVILDDQPRPDGEDLQKQLSSGSEAGFYPRRKLETEDSSYDSDHEYLTNSCSLDSAQYLSSSAVTALTTGDLTSSTSHDDVSRSYSETLGQEFAEYVSLKNSRDSSPTLSERLDCLRESPGPTERLECVRESQYDNVDIYSITQNPRYNAKVEFALKLGYPEALTQKALLKVGLNAQQNELLDELIRLQQIKSVDPKELLLKEAHELLASTLSNPILDSPRIYEAIYLDSSPLRPIVIDGSNVAMSHGNKEKFSCRGIQLCVQWFQNRGHKDITVFVPKWRKESSKPESPTTAQHILTQLEKDRLLIFTPSRQVGGRRVVCLDDRFILNLAADTDAVVVSNDNFRELINEKPEFRRVIEERVLMYSFVNDRFMPPDDPLGRNGPTLEAFLRKTPAAVDTPPPCPYGKKCTYGNKCKFYHAERGNFPHKSVTDRLKEQSIRKIMEVRTRNTSRDSSPGELARAKSINLMLHRTESDTTGFNRPKQSLSRTMSSRPAVCGLDDVYADSLLQISKTEISKSKSTDISAGGRFRSTGGSGADWNLELGCLSNYGLGGLIHSSPPPAGPPPPGPWNTLVPPPATSVASPQDGNSHRRLERQLTINPAFDPRINKPRFPKTQEIISSAAMEYMHRNPPPPFGLPTSDQDFPHQNVTRIASAPDSIRQWGVGSSTSGLTSSAPIAVVEPMVGLGSKLRPALSPLQRSSSSSDSHLHTRSPGSGDTYSDQPWKYKFESGLSPILGGSSGQGSSIWGPLPSSVPTSPGGQNMLGPVGSSRPGKVAECRLELQYHLSALFPQDQVDKVLKLMPDEQNPATLCAAIMKMFPAS